ncbi:MAG: hypothetical protein ACREXS_07360, partial [Gammaproteobacteria bacterium]
PWSWNPTTTNLNRMFDAALAPSAHIAETYAHHGVVLVRSLLGAAEVAEIREMFTAQVEEDRSIGHDDGVPPDDVLARYPRIVHPHRRTDLPFGRLARRWMLDPRIVDRVAEMIGPPLAAQSMFYFKPPTARGQARVFQLQFHNTRVY